MAALSQPTTVVIEECDGSRAFEQVCCRAYGGVELKRVISAITDTSVAGAINPSGPESLSKAAAEGRTERPSPLDHLSTTIYHNKCAVVL